MNETEARDSALAILDGKPSLRNVLHVLGARGACTGREVAAYARIHITTARRSVIMLNRLGLVVVRLAAPTGKTVLGTSWTRYALSPLGHAVTAQLQKEASA